MFLEKSYKIRQVEAEYTEKNLKRIIAELEKIEIEYKKTYNWLKKQKWTGNEANLYFQKMEQREKEIAEIKQKIQKIIFDLEYAMI